MLKASREYRKHVSMPFIKGRNTFNALRRNLMCTYYKQFENKRNNKYEFKNQRCNI